MSPGRSRGLADPLLANRPPMAVAAIRHDPPALRGVFQIGGRGLGQQEEASAPRRRSRPAQSGSHPLAGAGLGAGARRGRCRRSDRAIAVGRATESMADGEVQSTGLIRAADPIDRDIGRLKQRRQLGGHAAAVVGDHDPAAGHEAETVEGQRSIDGSRSRR